MKDSDLRKLVLKNKKNLKESDVYESERFNDLVRSLLFYLTRNKRNNIQVKIAKRDKNGVAAYTDGKTVNIFYKNSFSDTFPTINLKVDSVLGLLFHEVGHLLYTNFDEGTLMINNIINKGEFLQFVDISKNQKEASEEIQVYLKKYPMLKMVLVECISRISNIIEDIYIETKLCAEYEGTVKMAIRMNTERLVEKAISVKKMKEIGLPAYVEAMNLILEYVSCGTYNNWENITDSATEKVDSIKELLDYAVTVESSYGRLVESTKILYEIWDVIKEEIDAKEQQISNMMQNQSNGSGDTQQNEAGNSSNSSSSNVDMIGSAIANEMMKEMENIQSTSNENKNAKTSNEYKGRDKDKASKNNHSITNSNSDGSKTNNSNQVAKTSTGKNESDDKGSKSKDGSDSSEDKTNSNEGGASSEDSEKSEDSSNSKDGNDTSEDGVNSNEDGTNSEENEKSEDSSSSKNGNDTSEDGVNSNEDGTNSEENEKSEDSSSSKDGNDISEDSANNSEGGASSEDSEKSEDSSSSKNGNDSSEDGVNSNEDGTNSEENEKSEDSSSSKDGNDISEDSANNSEDGTNSEENEKSEDGSISKENSDSSEDSSNTSEDGSISKEGNDSSEDGTNTLEDSTNSKENEKSKDGSGSKESTDNSEDGSNTSEDGTNSKENEKSEDGSGSKESTDSSEDDSNTSEDGSISKENTDSSEDDSNTSEDSTNSEENEKSEDGSISKENTDSSEEGTNTSEDGEKSEDNGNTSENESLNNCDEVNSNVKSQLEQMRNSLKEMFKDGENVKINSPSSADDTVGNGEISESSEEGQLNDELTKSVIDMVNSISKDMAYEEAERSLARQLSAEANSCKLNDIHRNTDINIHRRIEVDSREMNVYETIKRANKRTIDSLIKEMENIVEKKDETFEKNRFIGKKLNKSPIQRDGRIFTKRNMPDDSELAVAILIDESGSMYGDRIKNALNMSIIISEFCEAYGIALGIYGHNSNGYDVDLDVYKEFDSIDGKDKYRLTGMRCGGCNRDGAALQFVGNHLYERPEEKKILIIISDGQPNAYSYGGDEAAADLRQIKNNLRGKEIILIAAAIGDDKDNIQDIYGKSYLNITDLKKMPKIFARIIEQYMV